MTKHPERLPAGERAAGPEQTRAYKLRTLATLTFGHANTHWFLGVLGPVLPLIARDLNLTFTQIGLLLTLRSLGASFGGASAGVLTDLLGKRKPLLVANLAVMGAMYASMGYANTFAFLFVPFLLTGILNSGWHPPAMSTLSRLYPNHRGFALGLHGSGASLAQSIAPLVIGYLLQFTTWREVMKIHLLPTLISAVLVFFLLPPILTATSGSVRQYSSDLIRGFRKNRALLSVAAVSCLRTMSYRTLDSFLPLYLAFHFGMGPAGVGFYVFLLIFSGTIPEAISGLLSDRIGRKGILMGGLLISTIALILIPFLPVGLPLGAAISVLGFSLISLRPIIMASGFDVTPPDLGGSTVGFLFSFNQLFTGIGPLVAGVIADQWGLGVTFYFMAALTAASALAVRILFRPQRQSGKIPGAPEVI